ncbi:Oidioi.mRNA.OKI2018_I69.chr1.g3658.t1.cds [Oikopleura dioica]|uniref:Oidioi.mRNA.OKI2018_I69.chr1.g3658.t1.cds n=1 Tax=Oikopleura dioica TaxID=34765 RepID=A0ABN7T0C2_OIKDI|nr:Oidioi.mRNA.OKI2018_I69.chr1.g3658.t1.cds [Oikopleura dioica]
MSRLEEAAFSRKISSANGELIRPLQPEHPSLCDPFLRPPLCGLILTMILISCTIAAMYLRFGSVILLEETWLIAILWIIAAFGLLLSFYGLRKGCRDRMEIEQQKLVYNMRLFGNQPVKKRLREMSQEERNRNSSRDSECSVFLECEMHY